MSRPLYCWRLFSVICILPLHRQVSLRAAGGDLQRAWIAFTGSSLIKRVSSGALNVCFLVDFCPAVNNIENCLSDIFKNASKTKTTIMLFLVYNVRFFDCLAPPMRLQLTKLVPWILSLMYIRHTHSIQMSRDMIISVGPPTTFRLDGAYFLSN